MRIAVVVIVGGALLGCAAPAPPIAAEASDPGVATRPVTYRPVVDDYISRRPVEPEDWRRRNEQVAPNGGDQ